jgi:aspartate racemase
MNKKKLGIIGGMGSRAGAFFFKKIIDYCPANNDQEFLEIIFHNNSPVPDRTMAIVYNEPSPLADLMQSIQLFNQNKVEVIAMGCITAYYYYNQICACTSATILNPLFIIAENLKKNYTDVKRVGILATTGSIKTGLFHRELKACNAEIVTLDPQNQEDLFMRSVYMKNGFKSAVISPEAYRLMEQAIEKLIERKVDLIVGGCTEVSIAIDATGIHVPYLDGLDLLARSTVAYCYGI